MFFKIIFATITTSFSIAPLAAQMPVPPGIDNLEELNNQIRKDKFDLVLPKVMRDNKVDMWIHVMREEREDKFGAGEFGTTSGLVIFTDHGGDRIERTIMGRRWGAQQRQHDDVQYKDTMAALGVYDNIAEPIRIQEPLSAPETEYDLRFKGLREFVEERNPKRIAVNFREELGLWPTFPFQEDGISHTDYLLLTAELGKTFAKRLVSSEQLITDYMILRVPSEVDVLKKHRAAYLANTKKAFDAIQPDVTKIDGRGELTIFRRMYTGQSQRGRSSAWKDPVVQRGDIVANPILGYYGYVLRDGETEPPQEIKKLWAEYLKVDKILSDTIRAGRTPKAITEDYTKKFAESGIIVRDDQLHMIVPKNDFPAYVSGHDMEQTHISIDAHGQVKGARPTSDETYYGPRIGSYGPDWVRGIPLPDNHHFVIEYFFYMPSPGPEGMDQYLLWWDHEEAIATKDGIEYLSSPQKELHLIR